MSTSPPQSDLWQRLQDTIASRATHAMLAARHAPLEVLLGIVMALLGCFCILDKGHDHIELYMRGMLMCLPTLLALFALSILAKFKVIKPVARWSMSLGFIALSTLYVVWRLDPDQYLSELWRWLTLCMGMTAGFAMLPLILVRGSGRRTREFFWSFNAKQLNHIALSASFLGALTIGLMFAMAAAKELLGIHIHADTFACVTVLIMVGMLPWQVVTTLPGLDREIEPQPEAFKELGRTMCTYLFLPLMSIYLVILYLYQLRVVLNDMEAPKNMMSPLVLAAAGMLLAGMLLADQLEPKQGSPRGLFLRVADRLPMAFLPLMPMSAWAVWLRVEQYGWTEFRYLRMMSILALSVIFIIASVQYLRKQPQPLMAIIGTFGVLSMLSTFGPLSAQAVSERSQVARLHAQLLEQDLIDPATGKIKAVDLSKTVSRTQGKGHTVNHETSRIIDYLAEHFGAAPFERFVSPQQLRELEEAHDGHGLNGYEATSIMQLDESFKGGATEAAETYQTLRFTTHHNKLYSPHAGVMYQANFYAYSRVHDLALPHRVMEKTPSNTRVELDEDDHLRIKLRDDNNRLIHAFEHDLAPLVHYLAKHQNDHQDFMESVPESLRVWTYSEEGVAPISVSIHAISIREDGEDSWHIEGMQTIIVQSDGPAPRD